MMVKRIELNYKIKYKMIYKIKFNIYGYDDSYEWDIGAG